MEKGWVKLHRKIVDNEILMRDRVMLQIFIYLLTICDRSGNYRVSRFKTAAVLDLNPNTFKDGLERLKRHHLITTKSTNKYTEIHIVNWARYQSTTPPKTEVGHHENTTNTRIKKQEYITTNSGVEDKILKFLIRNEKITNPKGYLSWLKNKYGELPAKLLDIEFNSWVEHLDYRSKNGNK